ncbi:5-carboxymethyl-2-hydroxymuconate Delta-isomerase [Peribacillus muralis]|uniref:5-carboxymethyl-2-hydroxymuconate Delta-isomerase n=1 Tax=Peribacillus muralis TaxID=264697 RepID=UPI0036703A4C
MPHIIVEYTDNIKHDIQIEELLMKMNDVLISYPTIFPIGGIRSRAIELKHYRVADGTEDDAFVHVILKIGAGRKGRDKTDVCDKLFATMEDHFAQLFSKRYLALSMELSEFSESGTYKKNNIHNRFK